MKYDLWRFLGVLVLSILIGFITGYTAFFIIFGLIFFIVWQYQQYSKILSWLRRRNDIGSPLQAGLVNDLCREIQLVRDRKRSRNAKLSGYLQRFQKATTALPDAVVILGRYGEIEWANDKAEEYMDIHWPQDNGLRISNLVRDPKLVEYLNLSHDEWDRALQLNAPASSEIMLEIRLSPYGYTQKLLVARDITSINRNNQMRKDFIANASHELRTPLTVVSGFLESFADDELCPQEWRSYIKQMRNQTARMQNLIADLLKLSSLEAKTDDDFKETVPVPDVLNSICSEARKISAYRDHRFNLNIDNTLYLKGNQQLIYSAFSNLVFNAVQYTPEQGEIDVNWFEDDTGLHMEVIDNGLGMAAEHIPRVTERFYRIDKGRSREKGGTGLGLAIVKHVLAKYGGKLEIISELGKGSLFRCDFPESVAVYVRSNLKKSLSA